MQKALLLHAQKQLKKNETKKTKRCELFNSVQCSLDTNTKACKYRLYARVVAKCSLYQDIRIWSTAKPVIF